MPAGAWVTLKQHRVEVAVALLAALASIGLGASIAIRIAVLNVSQACLDQVHGSIDGSGIGDACLSLVRQGTGIIGSTYLTGEGTVPLSVMGALPFVLGLLGGVPIVARELEDRTAQTAWSLFASRTRWLAHQIAPIALLLGLAMVLASVVAMPVADDWIRWGFGGRATLIGLQGPLAVVRAFGAFGIGLAVGALLGRTLPAFLFAAALVGAVVFAAGQAHWAWLVAQPAHPIADEVRAVTTTWGWVTPSGELISREAARQLATDAGVPPAAPGDVQDEPALTWLEAHDYQGVPLGLTDAEAMSWAPFDGLIFCGIGAGGLGVAYALVHRRRAPG